MNLLNPFNLLWALPLLGGIVALWMLRLKRQDVTVSSLYLWSALLQETQANAPFQKLRRNLLLFLQLLTAFLLVCALARPFVYGQGLTGHTIVLVLDTSASMNATDVRGGRLAAAKAAADSFVDREMHGGDVATVLSASNKADSLMPGFTGDKNRLKTTIDGAAGTDTVADMFGAMTLAQSLVGARGGAEIRVFSDGAYSSDDQRKLGTLPLAGTDVKLLPVGTTTPDNLAITRLDGRRDPQTGSYQVFVQVQDLGGRPHAGGGTLSLLKDGKLIDARALSLNGGIQAETFNSPLLKDGGVVTARLDDVKDDLATDNQASVVLSPPRQRKVLLVSPGNLFLERGLNLDPDVVLEECSLEEFATVGKSGAGYGMVVFDGALPATPLPPGNYLVLNALSDQMPLSGSGSADDPAFIDQSHTHPAMRFVDMEGTGLQLRKALRTQTQPWGESLADADSGPLLAAGEHNGLRVISVAFDLSDSNWPMRISFPIFLTNAVRWLTAAGGLGASQVETPTGGVASLTLPPGPTSVSITRPDGSATAVAAPAAGGIVLIDDTRQAGLYHARANGVDYPFAVNLDSRDESTLAAQNPAALNHPGTPAAEHLPLSRRAKDDLWPTLAAVALGFLLLEWFVFHRRI